MFPGLLAAALLLDYVLVVAAGISAGVGALVSAVPALLPYTLTLCPAILVLIAIVNLRGVRDSGVAFILPTYLFVACLFAVIAIGLVKTWLNGGQPVPVDVPPALPEATATATVWLLLLAFTLSQAGMVAHWWGKPPAIPCASKKTLEDAQRPVRSRATHAAGQA